MDSPELNFFEFILGAILFGIGLLYLSTQQNTVGQLTDKSKEIILEDNVIYQHYSNENLNWITDEELSAMVMGYREYPIVIDGAVITPEDLEYEENLSLIKAGIYTKAYECDADNEIIRIIYTYAGT